MSRWVSKRNICRFTMVGRCCIKSVDCTCVRTIVTDLPYTLMSTNVTDIHVHVCNCAFVLCNSSKARIHHRCCNRRRHCQHFYDVNGAFGQIITTAYVHYAEWFGSPSKATHLYSRSCLKGRPWPDNDKLISILINRFQSDLSVHQCTTVYTFKHTCPPS